MLLLIFGLDLDVSGRHSVLPNFLRRKLPAGNLQGAEFRAQMLNGTAGIDQSAEGHVAADARKTVKIRKFHGMAAERWDFQASNCLSAGCKLILSAQPKSVKPGSGNRPFRDRFTPEQDG